MLTTLRKVGNSCGVVISKPLLARVGITGRADMQVENGAIVLRPAKRSAREGWAGASAAIATDVKERSAWPEFGDEGDAALRW